MEPPDERRACDFDQCKPAWSAGLKAGYSKVAHEPMPDKFRELLKELEDAESRKR
jgi:hypothetical protein